MRTTYFPSHNKQILVYHSLVRNETESIIYENLAAFLHCLCMEESEIQALIEHSLFN